MDPESGRLREFEIEYLEETTTAENRSQPQCAPFERLKRSYWADFHQVYRSIARVEYFVQRRL